MKQRVLILGADNLVTAAVRQSLLASDWAAPVTTSGSSIPDVAAFQEIDAVFNGVMGRPSSVGTAASTLYRTLARANRRIRVVHLSSMTVYGSFTGIAHESTELQPDLGAYGAAHIEAESLARGHADSVILRPGCEYGPNCPQWSERVARLLLAHRLGDLGNAGDGICNLLFIDDLVAAVSAALRVPGIDGQSINLAMRSPPTWNEYFARFGKELGAVPISRIGARRLKIERKLLAPPLKVLELVERRVRGRAGIAPPALTPSFLDLCAQDITLDVDKAETLLGLHWSPLGEGLRRAAAAIVGSATA
jgi:nucleoside-diphosphate-sugar epimerase